jgi:hypothetical protein
VCHLSKMITAQCTTTVLKMIMVCLTKVVRVANDRNLNLVDVGDVENDYILRLLGVSLFENDRNLRLVDVASVDND